MLFVKYWEELWNNLATEFIPAGAGWDSCGPSATDISPLIGAIFGFGCAFLQAFRP